MSTYKQGQMVRVTNRDRKRFRRVGEILNVGNVSAEVSFEDGSSWYYFDALAIVPDGIPGTAKPDPVAALAADAAAAAEAAADKIYADAAAWLAGVRQEWPGAMFICIGLEREPVTPELAEGMAPPLPGQRRSALKSQVHVTEMHQHEVFAGTASLMLHMAAKLRERGCLCPECRLSHEHATSVAHFLLTHGARKGPWP